MAGHARTIDYSSGESGAKLQGGASTLRPAGLGRPQEPAEEPLHLLARAVHHFHTYPATSPLCRSAVEACQRSLAQVVREHLSCRVTPSALVVNEVPVGAGTLIEHELARRLHAAAIAQLTIDQGVSIRELTHFCCDLLAVTQRAAGETGLVEMLVEHGVDRIGVRPAYHPEVLDVAPPAPTAAQVLNYQRAQREQTFASGGPVDHLYPPDKGWVRVDPAANLPAVSLIDLAVLADDPASLAGMLVRLTDDETAGDTSGDALTEKYSDVATLFAALDPKIARVMFSKLARAVLDLDVDRRQALLRRTILPGLLDGKIDGTVLNDFPDVDLAESLCLLLDLETAAPEVVTTALARLDLSAERQAAIIPLIEDRVAAHAAARPGATGLDAHARRLVSLDPNKTRSFAEFSAFDLALDPAALESLDRIRGALAETDVVVDQLECLCHLVRLQPNPELVQRFVSRTGRLLIQLEGEGRWAISASWLVRFRSLEDALREPRPDVADVLGAARTRLCTPDRARRIVELAAESDAMRAVAGQMVEALGAEIGPALLEALQTRSRDGRDQTVRACVQLLCDHAAVVAPALAAAAGRVDAATERVIARVLGLAGPGGEGALGTLLEREDEQTVREALRSLARIGTPKAAQLVAAQIARHTPWNTAAEQTLWHFPPAESHRQVRQLLSQRDFLLRQPEMAGRLLDRAAQGATSGFEPILQAAAGLQYRFWKPAVMRVGRKARALLAR